MTDIFALFDKIRSTTPPPRGPVTHLVVGLGNPGEQYAQTRHNAGFLVVDDVAEKAGVKSWSLRFDALVGDAMWGGKRVLFVKPQTYMNLSGKAVAALADYYKIPPQNIIVVCDDVSFDTGVIRLRLKGSHGGHNGLKDIEARLGSQDYIRYKVGVGKKPSPETDLADWVLGKFTSQDLEKLPSIRERVGESIRLLLEDKTDDARNRIAES